MERIEEFNNFAEACRKEINTLSQRERAAILKKKSELVARHDQWLAEGLPYAVKIFSWADSFRKTDGYTVAIEAMKDLQRNATTPSLLFFSTKESRHSIPNLSLRDDGTIGYCGHDFTGSYIERRPMLTPEELAIRCDPKVLKMAWESIENGWMYKEMEDHLGRYLRSAKSNVCHLEE